MRATEKEGMKGKGRMRVSMKTHHEKRSMGPTAPPRRGGTRGTPLTARGSTRPRSRTFTPRIPHLPLLRGRHRHYCCSSGRILPARRGRLCLPSPAPLAASTPAGKSRRRARPRAGGMGEGVVGGVGGGLGVKPTGVLQAAGITGGDSRMSLDAPRGEAVPSP